MFMPFKALLHEVDQLNNVSERLEGLADQHPFVTEALTAISRSVRNIASVLEVLVAIRAGNRSEGDPMPA
jgi:hypothetical protein